MALERVEKLNLIMIKAFSNSNVKIIHKMYIFYQHEM